MMNGTMDEEQRNGPSYGESTHSGSIRQRDRGTDSGARKIGKYTYRLVHAQESIRVLDLRLDIAELADVTDLGELLGGLFRGIVEVAAIEELECLNNQVRYKDS